MKNHQTEIRPRAAAKTNATEFTWVAQHVPGLRIEAGTPSWYDPYAWVQLSEFRQWSDVNNWALSLFSVTNKLNGELAAQIAELAG